jgi:two-component system response regulator AtoC
MGPTDPSVLVIDDDRHLTGLLAEHLARRGHPVRVAHGGRAGLTLALELRPRLVLLDLRLGDLSGLEVLDALRTARLDVEVVILTGHPEVSSAIAAIDGRVAGYLVKPFALDQLDALLARLLGPPPGPAAAGAPGGALELIGEAPATHELRRLVARLARSPVRAALITGESGTGKDLVARLIHEQGPRRERRFVDVNCAAVTEALFESEFFGHERGAFTGAVRSEPGLAEVADGGTLLLDEIGELSRACQAKLLRFVEDQSFFRVGGRHKVRVDVQIIAATNRDLPAMVEQQLFRQDLYFRLDVATVALRPLRERVEDVVPLARYWTRDANQRLDKRVASLAPEVEAALCAYPWPGNVRELRNVIERLVLFAESDRITLEDLPVRYRAAGTRHGAPPTTLAGAERRHIEQVLAGVGGNTTRAAELLGISRQTLRSKLLTSGE